MTIALLFPGQGEALAQSLPPWIASSSVVRGRVEEAAHRIGMKGSDLTARGGRSLASTEVYQPVLVALCLGVFEELLVSGVEPAVVAGHSLGEVTAWAAAGVIDVSDAIDLASSRGRLMAREAARHPGGMAAVDPDAVPDLVDLLRRVGGEGTAVVAGFNSPRQLVVSADASTLRALHAVGPFRPLDVPGAWHSPAMAGAVDELERAVAGTAVGTQRCPVVINRTGELRTGPDGLSRLLSEQLTRPVHWVGSMQTMEREGIQEYVAVGPAKSLRGLARACLGPGKRIHAVELPDDLSPCVGALAA